MACEPGYNILNTNTSVYYVTIYREGVPLPGAVDITCYDAISGMPVSAGIKKIMGFSTAVSNQFSACSNSASLNNAYMVLTIPFDVTLPENPNGYLLAASVFGRDTAIVNIYDPGSTGILFTTHIPGTINSIDYRRNKSPVIDFGSPVTVCKNTPFSFRLLATDPDGDSLSFYLGDAVDGVRDTTTSPPNIPVQYLSPSSGPDPLGTGASIDPITGLFQSKAPDKAGGYTIAIYVQEWRAGVLINTTKKESQIKVVSCPFAPPLLKPLYSHCGVRIFNFKTEPTCPAITSYRWDFGDPNLTADTSLAATPSYTYPGTGTYILKLRVANNDGYIDSATATVKVVDSIPIYLRSDTAICRTDTFFLRPVSDGVNYTWTESGGGNTLSSYTIKTPKAIPVAGSTTYAVTTTLDACIATASITIYSSPYPKSGARRDTAICIGQSVTLNGSYTGAYYTWTPTNTLTNSNTLQPIATPQSTTPYVLSVRDTFYCPKTVTDTVVIRVVQAFTINAGNDRSVVIGQPLQLKAVSKGNTTILQHNWQPASYFNNNGLYNPVATIKAGAPDQILFTVTGTTVEGCSATDNLLVRVFTIAPDILVPTAFTPNGDGKNDVLKPVLIGMKSLERFVVYNRWGQVVFSTTENNKGWDGTVNGSPQNGDVFVFTAEGINYFGKKIFKKGTVVLIR